MKIKDAKVFVCSPGRNFVTLKIYTDEGIYGLGDCTLNGRELAVASYLTDHVIPCIIGRDPFQTEDLWQYLYRGAYWRKGPVTMSAIPRSTSAAGDAAMIRRAKAGWVATTRPVTRMRKSRARPPSATAPSP